LFGKRLYLANLIHPGLLQAGNTDKGAEIHRFFGLAASIPPEHWGGLKEQAFLM
jgi:hypothetical protein